MVRDLRAGLIQDRPASSFPVELTALNGVLFFSADNGIHGRELWRTNDSIGGTTEISALVLGSVITNPSGLLAWNNSLLFSDNSALGRELA